MLIVINLGEKMAMDSANPAEADKLFEGVPWEAWNEVTAGPEIVNRLGGIESFMHYWLTVYDWNENDGWKPKRK